MKNFIFILFSILIFGACHSPKYLSKPMDFKYNVKGLILQVILDDDSKILGEIIEANSEAIKILPVTNGKATIMTISKKNIQSAEIIVSTTSDDPEGISLWASVINIAPVGHGFFMILSVPVNLISTISIGNDAAKGTYRMSYPKNVPWEQMSKFARFPQGIPSGIDVNLIK